MHRFLPVVAFCLTILSLSAQGGLSVLQHPVKQEKYKLHRRIHRKNGLKTASCSQK